MLRCACFPTPMPTCGIHVAAPGDTKARAAALQGRAHPRRIAKVKGRTGTAAGGTASRGRGGSGVGGGGRGAGRAAARLNILGGVAASDG